MIDNNWKKDFQSSVVVFLVALPLCLGIAMASGAPLSAGIFAGIIGGVVIGLLSQSPISVSGPANGLTVIIAAGIQTLGSFEAVTMSILVGGLVQLLFSYLRFGVIGDYFPTSVIKGMLAAIGIILILKQLPHAVGFDADYMGDEAFFERSGGNTFSHLFYALQSLHAGAVLISCMSILIILFWDKMVKKNISFYKVLPGPLVAIITAICANHLFNIYSDELFLGQEHLVSLPFSGGVEAFFSQVNLPNWAMLNDRRVLILGFSIALVGSLESLLSVDAADKIDEKKRITDKNKELKAQGIGNILCGLVGGIPVASVIVRSSVNVSAGAQTKLSTVLHGVWIFLCVILIPNLLNKIPLPVLSSILLVVGYRLSKPSVFKSLYEKGINQFIPFLVTIIAILFSNLLIGILIGISIGFIFVIKSNIHKSIAVVNEDNLYLIRFFKDVSFLQKSELNKIFNQIPENSTVIIDGSTAVFVDDDIVDAIEEFIQRGNSLGIKVQLKKSTLSLCPIFKEA